jgi:hypothetical protein
MRRVRPQSAHGKSVQGWPILRGVKGRGCSWLGLAAILVGVVVGSRPARAEDSITHCDTASLAAWKFSKGVEYPGAQGSLSSNTGYLDTGAHLAYDLSAGGKYVAATLALSTPAAAQAIGLWLRTSVDARPELQLRDASGQTLVYQLVRPLEASAKVDAWYHLLVDVAAPTNHFGGADDGAPHPPFSSMAMVVSAGSGTTGWVDFDEINALDSFSTTLEPAALPLIAAEPTASNLANRLAVNVHGAHEERALDAAHDIGFRAVRVDLLWANLERTLGTYDFSLLDALVDRLASRGMRLHLILDYGNDLYPAPTAADYAQTTVPAFARMARTIGARFAGKHVSYEIWNEPNSERFWPVAAGPSVYASLVQTAARAIHEGDPLAQVSTGGVAGFDYEFVSASLSAGAAQGTNAVGVHPYRRGGGESLGNDLLRLRALLTQVAPALPVWATEWGYASTWDGDGHGSAERKRQSELAVREILSAWAVNVPLIVYYELRDDGTDATNAEHNFGLLQYDYSDKPAVVAVRTLTRIAAQRSFVGLLDTGVSGLHAMRLDGASDIVVALWSDRGNRSISVRLPAQASVVDLLGNARAGASSNAQELTISEADGPCYVMFPLPSSGAGAGGGGQGGQGTAGNALPAAGTGGAAQAAGGTAQAAGGAHAAAGSNAGDGGGGNSALGGATGHAAASGALSAGEVGAPAAAPSGCTCTFATPRSTSGEIATAWLVLVGLGANWRRRRRAMAAPRRARAEV